MTATLPGGPRLTRRQAIAAGSLTAAVLLVGPLAVTQAQAAEPVDAPLHTLPRRFGTPTDLARRHPLRAWTRESDGRVMTFDKATETWKRAAVQDWPTVVGYGQPTLLRWGRASGTQLVVVFGTAPTEPAPTDPPTSTAPTPPVTGAPSAPSAGHPQLSATGVDLGPLGLAGTLLVGAGAALLALRRRNTGESPPTTPK